MDEDPAPAGPVSDHVAPHRPSNDGDVLNPDGYPDGRVLPNGEESATDQTTPNKQLISCKNYTIFSTFNALTLGPLNHFEELAANAKSQSIDVIAIQIASTILMISSNTALSDHISL